MRTLSFLVLGAAMIAVSIPGCGEGEGESGTPARVTLEGCDPLVPSYCGFPYPNDAWTIDADTPTGARLALPEAIMPESESETSSQPGAFNEADGFSAGIAAMAHMPGATAIGLPTSIAIGESLDDASPTVIIDAETGERLAHWAELDEYVVTSKQRVDDGKDDPEFVIDRPLEELKEEQALMVRPAIRPDDATRYIVAIRNVVDESGTAIEPSPAFKALRDQTESDDEDVTSRRAYFEDIFQRLQDAGIERESLQLAWDYTTASRENNTQWMIHIRDEAFETFPDGVTYSVAVINEDVAEETACRLEITFDMPLYTTGGETGSLLNFGEDGMPEQNGTYEYAAAMVVPNSAQEEPAPLVAFGHGFLGAKEQVLGSQEIGNLLNLAFFGLDFKGFSSDDQSTVVGVLLSGDFSEWRAIPERQHQGYLNFLMAMRTLKVEAEGPAENTLNTALTESCGGAELDGTKRYYFGGSQGGIFGASLMAIWTDVERGVLAVPGQSYNVLINRSTVFDDFAELVYPRWGWNALDVQFNLALIQGLWDRSEPTGYSKYIRTNTLPGTPAHEVLIQISKSDHQVTNVAGHIMARSIGGVVNLAPTIRTVWGMDEVTGGHDGSGMVEIDFGNDEVPVENVPPWGDSLGDPHGRATEVPAIGDMLIQFYETGTVENLCVDESGENPGPCDENDVAE